MWRRAPRSRSPRWPPPRAAAPRCRAPGRPTTRCCPPAVGGLGRALVRAGRVARRPGLVVVVSDFREEGWRAPLAALGARHSVVAVEVCDPREAALPSAGHLALVDPETGALVEVDSSRARVRERYAALEADRRESVAADLRAAGADHVVLDTGHDWLRALGRGFDRRRARRRPDGL